ncbi:hypothetical protein [Membranihabitans maritimus]|uniref:hypothetical protein n=1 Tax=Membranihabitans maritimus TaxID=2904244 RepID=UPI001F2AA972|nr:hypothetical protein [Membranihabitans maritimus]
MNAQSLFNRISPYPLFYPFWMSGSEKRFFDRYIKNAQHYLEFGIGGSTIRALLKSKARISSVESNPEWLAKMREYRIVKHAEQTKRLEIDFIDIGKTGHIGFPANEGERDKFPDYSSRIFHENDLSGVDCVLIDGRFRVACALQTILHCHRNPNLHMTIHDIWSRSYYHGILKYLIEIERVDRIGVFRIREHIDIEQLKTEYDKYKYDPR